MGKKTESISRPEPSSYAEMALKAGASNAKLIPADEVYCAEWVRLRCQYGCGGYGRCLTCPPYSPSPEQTAKVLAEFSVALLIHGDGNTDVSDLAADIERQAFIDGYYKAFSLHSGPCGNCEQCDTSGPCRHPYRARPAMEAAGIDVFATTHKAGLPLEVARDRSCPGNYYSLVLLE